MIRFENVVKKYGDYIAVSNLSFTIEDGKIVVLIGESGCGKTTTLKMINRLITQTSGEIYINNVNIKTMDVIELRRSMGYVIQQIGLFPHMTVKENVTLIAQIKKMDEKTINNQFQKLMNMVELNPEHFLDRYPTELSGGEQQRVGFVRAFLTDPEIVLMDEPFSALDPLTRKDLQEELLKVQLMLHKTIVFVTHDMDEALKLADEICIMDHGEIVQYDTPENILRSPKNEFVRKFVGEKKIWSFPKFIHASDIMIPAKKICQPSEKIEEIKKWMKENNIEALPVIDENGILLGTVDYKNISSQGENLAAKEICFTNYIEVQANSKLPEILEIFNKNKELPEFHLIVRDNERLCGVITERSLVQTLQSYINPNN